MERQRGRRDVEALGDLAGRQAVASGLHQQAEHVETIFLGEGRKRGDGSVRFHHSMIIES